MPGGSMMKPSKFGMHAILAAEPLSSQRTCTHEGTICSAMWIQPQRHGARFFPGRRPSHRFDRAVRVAGVCNLRALAHRTSSVPQVRTSTPERREPTEADEVLAFPEHEFTHGRCRAVSFGSTFAVERLSRNVDPIGSVRLWKQRCGGRGYRIRLLGRDPHLSDG